MNAKKQRKHDWKEKIASTMSKANAIVLAEYRGLTVEELTILRRDLRKATAEFRVVKNRVAKKAIAASVPDMIPLLDDFKGPLGAVYVFGDVAKAAKSVLDFSKEKELFKIRAAFIDKAKVSENDLKAIASLPSKEVILAQIIGSLVNPHRNLLSVLNGVSRSLVQVLAAIRDKKQS